MRVLPNGVVGLFILFVLASTSCVEATVESTATPTPPTATSKPRAASQPTGTLIGNWTVLRGGIEEGELVGIVTQSVQGEEGALNVTCHPEHGIGAFVIYGRSVPVESGLYDIHVSTGSESKYDIWDLSDDGSLLTSLDPLSTLGLLRDSEALRINVDRKHEFSLNPLFDSQDSGPPMKSSTFDTSEASLAIRQVFPCVGVGTLPASPTPTSESVAQPRATSQSIRAVSPTPTPTAEPTPQLAPTATPAPPGTRYGMWRVLRDAQSEDYVALVNRTESLDKHGSELMILCTGTGLLVVGLRGFVDSEARSSKRSVKITAGEIVVTEDWVFIEDSVPILVSSDPENTIQVLQTSHELQLSVDVALDSSPRLYEFDLSGIESALQQVYPCVEGKVAAPADSEPAGFIRANPIPLGETGVLQAGPEDHWEITVLNVVVDASDMANYTFVGPLKNAPPTPSQLYLVSVRVTYLGEASQYSDVSKRITAWGNEERRYSPTFDRCGIITDPFPKYVDLSDGVTLEGNICWEIAVEDADDLVMSFEPDLWELMFGTTRPMWFALGSEK